MITPKRYEIGCQLLLITNRGIKEVAYGLSIGTDLDDLDWRNSPYFAFFTEFGSSAGRLYHSG